jgi:hypothetical protein
MRGVAKEAAWATGMAPSKTMNPADTRGAILGMILSGVFP